MIIRCACALLLLLVCTSCTTTGELSDCVFCAKRTYRVLDTTAGEPIPHVEVTLSQNTTIPGPGSPGLLSHKTDSLKSDEQGTFVALKDARISLRKNGYENIDTIREYLFRKTETKDADPKIYFLTPQADLATEQIKYLFYTQKDLYGRGPILVIVSSYELAKIYSKTLLYPGRTNTVKVIEALHEYCRFVPELKAQTESGWPDIRSQQLAPGVTRDRMIKSGRELIDDCEPRHSEIPSNRQLKN
jgi:hypothetical protein